MYKAKFHSQRKKKREAYIALDLVQDHVHEAKSSSSPTTTTITKIDYNSQKITKNH
jgi:Cu/Ag efflux protein CusF